jgi:hypothetical protein
MDRFVECVLQSGGHTTIIPTGGHMVFQFSEQYLAVQNVAESLEESKVDAT